MAFVRSFPAPVEPGRAPILVCQRPGRASLRLGRPGGGGRKQRVVTAAKGAGSARRGVPESPGGPSSHKLLPALRPSLTAPASAALAAPVMWTERRVILPPDRAQPLQEPLRAGGRKAALPPSLYPEGSSALPAAGGSFPARPSRSFPEGPSRGEAAFSAEVGRLPFSGSEATSALSKRPLQPARVPCCGPGSAGEAQPEPPIRNPAGASRLPAQGARAGRERRGGFPGGRDRAGVSSGRRIWGDRGGSGRKRLLAFPANSGLRPLSPSSSGRRAAGFGVPGSAGKGLPAAPRRPGETDCLERKISFRAAA